MTRLLLKMMGHATMIAWSLPIVVQKEGLVQRKPNVTLSMAVALYLAMGEYNSGWFLRLESIASQQWEHVVEMGLKTPDPLVVLVHLSQAISH